MYLNVEIEKADNQQYYQTIDSQMEADELMAMIKLLPSGYRTVFNLYAIEGYSHKEISLMLDINENTSKSQLSRARKYLQALLAKYEQKANAIIQ